MKIKNLLAYRAFFAILTVLVLTLLLSPPVESESVKACKKYPGCAVLSQNAPNWLNFR